jgi:CO dehydrogenase/acetyl-CoA synthase alpha subunit
LQEHAASLDQTERHEDEWQSLADVDRTRDAKERLKIAKQAVKMQAAKWEQQRKKASMKSNPNLEHFRQKYHAHTYNSICMRLSDPPRMKFSQFMRKRESGNSSNLSSGHCKCVSLIYSQFLPSLTTLQ